MLKCQLQEPFNESDQLERDGLVLQGPPFGYEEVQDYRPNGHHPVHLGDRLGEKGQYRVLHKLGHGGFVNVWLCRDLTTIRPKYNALKILMAYCSGDDTDELLMVNKLKTMDLYQYPGGEYICLPSDQFRFDGPAGTHLCFVYPVAGPRVSEIVQRFDDQDRMLRKFSLQAVQVLLLCMALGFVMETVKHSLWTTGFDAVSEVEVLQALGKPRSTPMNTLDPNEEFPQWAPLYLVKPVDFTQLGKSFLEDRIY